MRKRLLLGHLTLLFALSMAIGGTFLLDYLETKTAHPGRLEVVFGCAGVIMGLASVMIAIVLYTNNLGEGFAKEK